MSLAIFAAPGFADLIIGHPESKSLESHVSIEFAEADAATPPENVKTYGTLDWVELNYGLPGFSPLEDGRWRHNFNGWGWRLSGANTATCHVVVLPSGARLAGYTVWFIDNHATASVRYELIRVNLVNNTFTNVLTVTSVGTPGTVRQFIDIPGPDHTVLNDRAVYILCINNTATGSLLQSSGVTFWYHLQKSPAPASPTFFDVPTSHTFYQDVEALAASGITVGCAPNLYCPNNPVTRGQMAAFLTRALGLHWPDL